MIAEKAWWSARTGVMSLKVTPSCGQSATSTVRRVSASWAVRRSGIGGRPVDRPVHGPPAGASTLAIAARAISISVPGAISRRARSSSTERTVP